MICDNCSKRLLADWMFCPTCGREVVLDERLKSHGVSYHPQAFEPEPYKLGRDIADDEQFYQVFIRYIMIVTTDVAQLGSFRGQVIHEAQRALGRKKIEPKQLPPIIWCALSLSTDRYFSDKALLYDWDPAEQEDLRSGWYGFMAKAFIPDSPDRNLDAKEIRAWVDRFLSLHKRITGPLETCGMCTAKCHFQYETEKFMNDEKCQTDFQAVVQKNGPTDAASIARFSNLLTQYYLGIDNLDLSYCLAIHLMKNLEVPPPPVPRLGKHEQVLLAYNVRNGLEDKEKEPAQAGPGVRTLIFDTIVKQALAGAPWRDICKILMQANKITPEEVEAEIGRRKAATSTATGDATGQ